MPLNDLRCRKAKAQQKLVKLSDMGGLQLWIYPNGSKFWRLAYRYRGKQKLMALGRYPDVSLIDARAQREKAKAMLREGQDPLHKKILAKIEGEFPGDSFEVVAKEYIEKLRREGRADVTLEKIGWMLGFALPVYRHRNKV